jgi:hypothetical protein
MVNALAGLNISRADVKLHRIVLESLFVERIENIRQLAVAEIRTVKITRFYERTVAAVSRIFAIVFVISDRSSDLAGFVIAAENRACGNACRPVKSYVVFHENIDDTACKHAAHGAAL